MEEKPEFLKPKEVAEILQKHVETVRQLIRDGVIPARKIGGTWHVPKKYFA